MTYAPRGKPAPVVKAGEFVFAATALDHGHIYGQCNGLIEAGGTLKWVYDRDPTKVAAFVESIRGTCRARAGRNPRRPGSAPRRRCRRFRTSAAASAAASWTPARITSPTRHPSPRSTQLDAARRKVARRAGSTWSIIASDCTWSARCSRASSSRRRHRPRRAGDRPRARIARGEPVPAWFFEKEKYGGILMRHRQPPVRAVSYLYAARRDAKVVHARGRETIANPDKPEFEDFGETSLVGDNGATNYIRVDWFTPDGLQHVGRRPHVHPRHGGLHRAAQVRRRGAATRQAITSTSSTTKGEQHFDCHRQSRLPYFGQLILDCLNRTENAMTQDHAFKAAELCLRAQLTADAEKSTS